MEFYFHYRNQILRYKEIYFSLSEIVRFLSIKFCGKTEIYLFLFTDISIHIHNLAVFFIIYIRFIFRCYNF